MAVFKSASLYLCAVLTTQFLLLAPNAYAQARNSAPSWASDQATADADMRNGQYEAAISVYERGIATAESGRPDAAVNAEISKMLMNEGNCLLKLHRTEMAFAAYEKAAGLSPDSDTAYFNLCATYYNAGNTGAALTACDKVIKVNPAHADAYFIKGSLLFTEATLTGGKYKAPPGTIEALNQYLALAPNGTHAADVKQMLDFLK